MAEAAAQKALHDIHLALTNGSNEDAKRPLVYPFFKALFEDKFHVESEAEGSDIYITGKLLVELKGSDWLPGFYQAQHYLKKGLSFSTICVLQNDFLAMWRLTDKSIPEDVRKIAKDADAHIAPNIIGRRNARATSKGQKNAIYKAASFLYSPQQDSLFSKDTRIKLGEWFQQLKNIDAARIQIRPENFIDSVESMEGFFSTKMEAIHAFYTIVGAWDVTSRVTRFDDDNLCVNSYGKGRVSDRVKVDRYKQADFTKFVEERYIFTNEGTGLTSDYYFSRFDEVISRLDPEYARQHGIFFTDINLSKFAIWFVRTYYEKKLGDKYIVIDPAGGSGNLSTSWKDHLKFKIVSELQPDLLKTIERRFKWDPEEVEAGSTIIPKTSENRGLNFLDKSAEAYYGEIKKALKENNIAFDKPLAFLLNPPYKNTDQNEELLRHRESNYVIDPAILALAGEDAGNERYLAFLAQILLITKQQVTEHSDLRPLVMIFTPTSWLIPRPTYIPFRREWDKYFKYERGFLITSNEFFKIPGRWPLAFTVWKYNPKPSGNENTIDPRDYTFLVGKELDIDWTGTITDIDKQLHKLVDGHKGVLLNARTPSIKEWAGQPMYDFKRDRTRAERESVLPVGGLPLKDPRRSNSKTYGVPNSEFVGLMDNLTPVRVKQDSEQRLSTTPDRIWFRLDTSIADVNKTRAQNGPSDNRSYCAFDHLSAERIISWYAMTKAVQGRNPLWSNQLDFWAPQIPNSGSKRFYSLCFAFVIAEANCVVAILEKNNPVPGASEIFVDNPLSPLNSESFLSTTLAPFIEASKQPIATQLLSHYRNLYKLWNSNYCKGKTLKIVGLKDEPYFKYFSYPDFVTPNSGLVQIKKFAQVNNAMDLLNIIDEIGSIAKAAKEEIYRMLVVDFKYFE